ncbi:integrase arm-type DNA-binding domain-containing protein [Cognatiyoonia sp. IB215446]|uniref:tyrosine-type recombinase/integrase n=1 Tax=Cognatiyoonia sp. IB215446 TaxID=3097355 RepID=UPI002A122EBA|nr:integrase arm-type DNA-binding domain-containing protein [Cognatiyoonia sp. IB215446]MDX8347397.1 integrase arm-type DNA-binding domain-containing protein [Cognatiyoonia sp. IB215446]
MAGIHRLTAAFVKNAPVGKHCDGAGLWFFKRADGGAQWNLRLTVHGRRREMGLGRFPDVTLGNAREAAQKWRNLAARGIDPIKERERERRQAERNLHTLADVTRECFEARQADLKGDGKAGRWMSPLEGHILPKLGGVPVAEIDQNDIKQTIAPIYHTKAETARKALNRLNLVLQHGAAMGLDVDLQAVAKARALLGKPRHTAKHIPAMPWADVPNFYGTLKQEDTITHLALRLLILTGARSGPVRFCHVDEIAGDTWTIPANKMKSGVEYRVPLSLEAQTVIDLARPLAREGFLFPSVRKGVISDATMARLMDRRKLEARPHGFRSSLRDWISETTNTPHDVAEACLAHSTGSGVETAYKRTDFLEQRRALLERWAGHITGASVKSGNVVAL